MRHATQPTPRETEPEPGFLFNLDERLASFSDAIAGSPTGIALLDRDGVISYANPRLCDLLSDDPDGHRLDSWVLERDAAAALRAALLADRSWRDECRLAGFDGDPVWCSVSIAPLPGGGKHRAVALIEDITERRRNISTLEAANCSLRRTNEARQAFVSIVSHELRTPLTAIRGAVELVAHGHTGPVDAEQERFLTMALRNLTRLSAILDDLLDLSKIDAGKLSLVSSQVDPGLLVAEVVQTFEARAASAGIELELLTQADLPKLWADPTRLHQVLANLVGNALKFTHSGGRIVVETRVLDNGGLELSVRDSGIGIAPENLPHVFERFWQVEDVMSRKRGGSGLGLAIARDIVEAHGGTINVESTVSVGSTFRVRLPVDGPASREMAIFEEHLTPHRRYPSFGVLVLEAHAAGEAAVLATAARAKALLPRTCDEVLPQPANSRVVVILGTTDRTGAEVVHRRLGNQLTDVATVHGPGMFPDDGQCAHRLVAAALPQLPTNQPDDLVG